MEKSIKDSSQTKKIFEIYATKEEIEKIKNDVLNELKRNILVPGFRKGRAPKGLIFQKYKKLVKDEIIKKILSEAGDVEKEISEKGINMVGDLVLKNLNFEFDSDFKAEFEFEIMPEFELKEIDQEEITIQPKKEITEKDVEDVLNTLAQKHSMYKPSEDGEIEEGDIVEISFLLDQKEEKTSIQMFPMGENKELLPLQKELLKMKKGEEKEISIKAKELKPFFMNLTKEKPDEEEIKIKIKIENIKKRIIPEINDEFAKQYFSKDTLEELKKEIKKELIENSEKMYENEIKNKILEKLRESNEFEIPQTILNNITKNRAYESARQIFGSVPKNIQNAITEMTFSSLEEGESKEDIKNTAKNMIILSKYIEKHEIEADEKDIKKKISEIASLYNIPEEKVEQELIKDEGAMKALREEIKTEKAFKMLKEKVKIKEKIEEKEKEE